MTINWRLTIHRWHVNVTPKTLASEHHSTPSLQYEFVDYSSHVLTVIFLSHAYFNFFDGPKVADFTYRIPIHSSTAFLRSSQRTHHVRHNSHHCATHHVAGSGGIIESKISLDLSSRHIILSLSCGAYLDLEDEPLESTEITNKTV